MSYLICKGSVSWDELQEGEEGPKTRNCRQEGGVWVAESVTTGETVVLEGVYTPGGFKTAVCYACIALEHTAEGERVDYTISQRAQNLGAKIHGDTLKFEGYEVEMARDSWVEMGHEYSEWGQWYPVAE